MSARGASAGAAIEADLVDHVYANLPTVLAANVVNGSIFAAVFAQGISAPLRVSWWGLILAVVAARGAVWLRYSRRDRAVDRLRVWRALAVGGAAASGVLWGAAGWLFFIPSSPTHYAALAFVLGGMAAGSLAASVAILPCFLTFLYLSLLPFVARLAFGGDLAHWSLTTMAVLFIGWFSLIGRRGHASLVRSLALAHENDDLVRTLEQRVERRTAALRVHARRQERVAEFGQRALAADEVEPLCHEAVALVAAGLGVEYAAVLEPSSDGGYLKVRSSFGWPPSAAGSARIPNRPEWPPGLALASDKAVVSEDAASDGRFGPPPPGEPGKGGCLASLIRGGSAPFGILYASSATPRRFSSGDVHFAHSVANMLAASIDKQRALDAVQHMALHDALTGLPNSTLFRDHLALALARFRRSGEAMAVVVLDLDRFKHVNDTMGHLAGDQVLGEVGRRLGSCVRDSDQRARLGGDEFGLILTDLRDRDDAAIVAAKIIAAIRAPFAIDGRDANVGVSIGIALCPADGVEPDALLRNADGALYRAKSRGGNDYEFHGDAHPGSHAGTEEVAGSVLAPSGESTFMASMEAPRRVKPSSSARKPT